MTDVEIAEDIRAKQRAFNESIRIAVKAGIDVTVEVIDGWEAVEILPRVNATITRTFK